MTRSEEIPDGPRRCGAADQAVTSLRQLAVQFGTTTRAIRYYEYLELIRGETRGRNRFYDHRARARLRLILRARHFGMRLEDIRQWLELYDLEGPEAQNQRWLKISCDRQAAIEQEIRDRLTILKDLRQTDDRVRLLLARSDETRWAAE